MVAVRSASRATLEHCAFPARGTTYNARCVRRAPWVRRFGASHAVRSTVRTSRRVRRDGADTRPRHGAEGSA